MSENKKIELLIYITKGKIFRIVKEEFEKLGEVLNDKIPNCYRWFFYGKTIVLAIDEKDKNKILKKFENKEYSYFIFSIFVNKEPFIYK